MVRNLRTILQALPNVPNRVVAHAKVRGDLAVARLRPLAKLGGGNLAALRLIEVAAREVEAAGLNPSGCAERSAA